MKFLLSHTVVFLVIYISVGPLIIHVVSKNNLYSCKHVYGQLGTCCHLSHLILVCVDCAFIFNTAVSWKEALCTLDVVSALVFSGSFVEWDFTLSSFDAED